MNKGSWIIMIGSMGDDELIGHGRGTQAEFFAAFEEHVGEDYQIEGMALNDRGGDVVTHVYDDEIFGYFILD